MRLNYFPIIQRDLFGDLAGNTQVQEGLNTAFPGLGTAVSFFQNAFKKGCEGNYNKWKEHKWSDQTVIDVLNRTDTGDRDAWIGCYQEDYVNVLNYISNKGNANFLNGKISDYQARINFWTPVLGADKAGALFNALRKNTNLPTSTPPLLNQPSAATPIGQNTVHVEMPTPTGAQALQAGTASTDTTAATTASTKKTWLILGIVGGVIVLGAIIFAVVKLNKK